MKKYSSYILYLLITFLVVILAINGFGPLDNLQTSIDDFLSRLTASDEVSPNIVIVSVDGKAQDQYGNWPWNYDLIADMVAATATAEPKAIALDFMLNEDNSQDSAGYTDILAGQIGWVKNLILPYDIALATFRNGRTNNPDNLFDYSIAVDNPLGIMEEGSSLQVRKVFMPAAKILKNDPYLGFDYTMPDDDRILRHQPMVMNYEGYYYPSQALLASALYLDVPVDQIKVFEGDRIELGDKQVIPITEKSEFYVNFPKSNFRKISAADLLSEGFNFSHLKNKLVLIEVDEFSSNQYYRTPVKDETTRAMVKAAVIENIIDNNIITVKNDMMAMNLLILFAFGGICAFVMPQVSKLYRFMILFGCLILLANINYFMVSSFSVMTQTIYFVLEIILFMIASPFLESELISGADHKTSTLSKKAPKIKPDKDSFGPISPKDLEAIPVREIVEKPDDSDKVATMAITDDDSGGFPMDHQAINIDDEIPEGTAALSDSSENSTSALSDDSPLIIGESDDDSGDVYSYEPSVVGEEDSGSFPINLDTDMKKLGRYEISGTLGKGAMGHVYKGIDPAINRPVALKTIRLDFVNDPAEMEELKERLFREAQAAGKLSHPNIVTIYDVGSEGNLQYIAMEYLEGQTLEDLIKKKTKFNYKIIAKIIIQICNALDYAHDKGIVHRDIKPANIMILPDYTVKIMDYGIARIDSNSMTKTGIAMGTPNYISPEQLKGMAVDRRADIFSLGVVIYELLLGRRPFRGENITSLIYAITSSDPMKPSDINPQIPLLFDHIIDRALKKDPNKRYQKAGDLMHDLSDFVDSFSIK